MKRKRIRRRIAALTIAVATIGAALPLATAPAASESQRLRFRVILSETGYAKLVDTGGEGLSAGDNILEIHPLYRPTSDRRVGTATSRVAIFRTPGEDATVYIDSEVTLPGGTIALAGAGAYSEVFSQRGLRLAVTGGTGRYAGAGGVMTFKSAGVEETHVLSFHLTK